MRQINALLPLVLIAAPCAAQHTIVELGKRHLPIPPDAAPRVAVGDFDRDGDPDLVRTAGGVVYENYGDARFAPRSRLAGFDAHERALTGDFDGDGDDDLLITDGSGTTIWHCDGRLGFTRDAGGPFAGPGLHPVQTADVNADGRDDLIGLQGLQVVLYLAGPPLGLGTVPLPPLTGMPYLGRNVHLFDVDGDGDLDLLANTTLARNDGTATFTIDPQGVTTGIAGNVTTSDVGDVDGDGRPDVVVATSTAQEILFNQGGVLVGTTFTVSGPTPGSFAGVTLVDADGDGRAELVWRDPPVLCRFTGAGFSVVPGALEMTDPTRLTSVITTADLDADGVEDLIGSASGMWLADGGGRFREILAPLATAAVSGDAGAVQADLNGDGDVDMIAITGSGELEYLVNRGDGTFEPAPAGAMPALPNPPYAAITGADFDGDADVDLHLVAPQHPTRGDHLLVNDGSGRFVDGSVALPPAPASVRSGHPVDLDRDGDVDLFRQLDAPTTSGDRLELLTNDGTGNLRTVTMLATAASAPLAFGDLDGDRDLDLVTHTPGPVGERLVTWIRDAAGNYAIGSVVRPNVEHGALALVDTDRDGDLDLLHAAGQLQLLANDGAGNFGNVSATHLPGAGMPDHFAVGDVDLDGDPDLVAGLHHLDNRSGRFVRTDRLRVWDETQLLYPTGGPEALVDIDGDGDLDLLGYDGRVLQNLHRHLHTPFLARPGHAFTWRISVRPGDLVASASAVPVIGFRELAFPLGSLGRLRVDPAFVGATLAVPAPMGTTDMTLPVPADPGLIGVTLHAQAIVLAPGELPHVTNVVRDAIR